MTEAGRRDTAREEMQRAGEELAVADHLASAGYFRIALTRAYFAVFHAVRARLYAENLEPRSHRGVQALFNLHFVKSGRYQPEAGRALARLRKYREEADYAEAFVVDERGAREEIDAARDFVKRVAEDLEANGLAG